MKKLYCLQILDKTLPYREWYFTEGSKEQIIQRANDMVFGYFQGFHAAHDFCPSPLILKNHIMVSLQGKEKVTNQIWYKESIIDKNAVAGLGERQTF